MAQMTPELWIVLVAAMIPGLLALAAMILSNVFAWNEREANIDNKTAETVLTHTETIERQAHLVETLTLRLNNLEAEIGEERALRRKDKQLFEERLETIKKQHNEELANIKSKYEYEMRALELRVKELEDELARAERDRLKVMKERDAARKENHGLLEENYKLRQAIAGGKTGKAE